MTGATEARPAATGRRRAALGVDVPLLTTAAIVAVLSWPLITMDAEPGLDPSWKLALQLAADRGMDYGPDVLFTFGPLGFLREPLYVVPWTARAAWVYTLVVQLALVLVLVWGLRRALGSLVLAGVLAVLVAWNINQEPVLVVAFGGAIVLLERARGRGALILAGAMGVLGGVEILGKLNSGVTVAALGVAAIAFGPRPRPRRLAAFAIAFAVTVALGWLGTGQPLSTIPSYLGGSLGIASGYAQAMGLNPPGRRWEYLAVAALGAFGAWAAWSWGPREARIGRLAVWIVLIALTFQSGFIRHDPGHANVFFATVVGALCLFAVPRERRLIAAGAGLVAVAVMVVSLQQDPRDYLRPVDRVSGLADQLRTLPSGRRLDDEIAAGRARIAAAYAVDLSLLALLRGRTVHADPVDTAAVWAYGLRWDPVPIFQTYSAYTTDLDERNADELTGGDAPERILRDPFFTVDGRNPAWDSPAAMRAMVCHYRSAAVAGRWQVLERVPDRCGGLRPLGEAKAELGEAITVPQPPDDRSAVVIEVGGLEVGGLETLRTKLTAAKTRYVTIDDARTYRLVPGTLGDGLVLEVPPSADGYPTPIAPEQTAGSLRFALDSPGAKGDREVTIRFLSMPIR